MRRLIAIPCDGDALVATLDEAAGDTGLLIVSGGNEIRCGAHRAMALLAARLAADGTPVFRYDRRGIGDSTGENRGYATAAPDLHAAIAAFRATGVRRIVAFGNCDAAALLATTNAALDALVLANPWTVEPTDDLPPAAAIRARYLHRLRNPTEWRKGVSISKLIRGLWKIFHTPSQPATLATMVLNGIAKRGENATVILARDDATAQAYAAAARTTRTRTIVIPTASHSFARAADQAALEAEIRAAIRRLP